MTALSARQHRTVLGLLCLVGALCVSFALSSIPRQLGMSAAHAQTAGSAIGSGSSTVAPLPSTLPDPTTDPGSFIQTLEAAKTHGWPFVFLIGLVGVLELAATLGKKIPALAWLGKGRVSVVIAGATTIGLAGVAVLLHAGTWGAAMVAIGGAGLAYWHQAGTDPAKS